MMPSSNPETLSYICSRIMAIQPKSVLDIGIGHGKWGYLTREYTDIWQKRYWDHRVKITGVEIFEDYIYPVHRQVYDNIIIGDILDLLDKLEEFDMILWLDGPEHFQRPDAEKVFGFIQDKSKYGIVSTPRVMHHQGPVFGNYFERHLTQWSREELRAYGNVTDIGNTYVLEMVKNE